MSFPRAVASALRQYVGFRGRARRAEFWWFFLFCLLAVAASHAVELTLGGQGYVVGSVRLALVLPVLAVSVRRMHDVDRSAWALLVNLVPLVGPLIFLMWATDDSHRNNDHGPWPKGSASRSAAGAS